MFGARKSWGMKAETSIPDHNNLIKLQHLVSLLEVFVCFHKLCIMTLMRQIRKQSANAGKESSFHHGNVSNLYIIKQRKVAVSFLIQSRIKNLNIISRQTRNSMMIFFLSQFI
jgi:hypothetical protein